MPIICTESREVGQLRLNEFSLGAFQPYLLTELEKFLKEFDSDLEQPIHISVNGYVLHGRKRYEAARLQQHLSKQTARLTCVVHSENKPIDIYRLTAEFMVADRDHTVPDDIEVARACLENAIHKDYTQVRDIIYYGTGNRVTAHALQIRTKVYGTNIVSYDVRRYIEEGVIEGAQATKLIRVAEQAFGGKSQAPVIGPKVAAARRYLDKIVEARIHNLPLPKPNSEYAVVSDITETPAAGTLHPAYKAKRTQKTGGVKSAPRVRAAPNTELWSNFRDMVREHYFAELLAEVDPAVRPLHEHRLQYIQNRFEEKVRRALAEPIDYARKQLAMLKSKVKTENVSFSQPRRRHVDFSAHYAKLGMAVIDERTPPEEALDKLKQSFRMMMKEHHPDKGGTHATATEVNESYAALERHWTTKQNGG